MWWASSKARRAVRQPTTSLWLGASEVVRLRDPLQPESLERQATTSVDEGVAQLQAWLADARPGEARLWLAGDVCQLIAVPAVHGAQSLAEAEAAARVALAPGAGMADQGDWRFDLHECPTDQALWRATLSHPALRPLTTASPETAWAGLRSMRPWWAWGLQLSADQAASSITCLAFDGHSLTTLARDAGGQLLRAETRPLSGGASAWRKTWLRLQAAQGVPAVNRPREATQTLRACVLDWATPADLLAERVDALRGSTSSGTAAEAHAAESTAAFAPWTAVLP